MKPKDWWSNPKNAKRWLRRSFLYDKSGDKSSKYVLERISNKFNSVLEVGAGSGRLIGKLSQTYPDVDCSSIDINPTLSKHVQDTYQIKTLVGEVIDLPIQDNTYQLVFTFQVLQHIPPEEIEQAISELKRVASKEVWLFEGWGNTPNVFHGHMRHKADGGTWYWDISKLIKCYYVEYLKESLTKRGEGGVKLYKIRV